MSSLLSRDFSLVVLTCRIHERQHFFSQGLSATKPAVQAARRDQLTLTPCYDEMAFGNTGEHAENARVSCSEACEVIVLFPHPRRVWRLISRWLAP